MKEFTTLTVIGAATGFCLEDNGLGKIHELFDFFWPGISTIGILAMAKEMTNELVRQIPDLKTFVDTITENNWESIAKIAVNQFGEKVLVHDIVKH